MEENKNILKDENIDETMNRKNRSYYRRWRFKHLSCLWSYWSWKPKPKDTREVIVPEVKDTVNKADTTE